MRNGSSRRFIPTAAAVIRIGVRVSPRARRTASKVIMRKAGREPYRSKRR